MLKVRNLSHGGIMANYQCTAACRHCLYACSPERTDGYISEENAREVCDMLKMGGCYSVHIGGGEPFLDFEGLITLVKCIKEAGIRIEYIETNASWATDEKLAMQYLDKLSHAGANALCISVDPYHAEYISWDLPLKLAKICQNTGFGFFLWQERYLSKLSQIPVDKIPNRNDLEKYISPHYIIETAQSYGLHLSGRAINIENEYASKKPVSEIIDTSQCFNLLSGGHFHVDMFGNFIPPGCTGITIPLSEAVNGIPKGKYPVFENLISGGVSELLKYAQDKGFMPNEAGYPSKCSLCFYIRNWLSNNFPSPDLDLEYYTQSLKFY